MCDLFEAQTALLVQQENVTLFLGQVLQCYFEPTPGENPLGLDFGPVTWVLLRIRLHIRGVLMALVAANMVDKTVVCDAIQEGREFRRRPVALARLYDLAPNLLENVLGGVPMPTEA